ncbi:bacteriohopanetetrol glucosamine biosynthesis glycosyltransferase HpnI [Dyella caseinilytica]|uniref:Bacteriohopanetetrol glucosamine biosynthesis glycosyltransferase HpnI n=1 Tax=Dyella caseinilytica TaxID=1849581 RepID=A0ABX7GTM5_9GAMM|nr:bacteriohopanetetrol glucosamine biosynthesis glycosyltransferase HpnI [Dyella caseinilytica]QRN53229.1 bacteriohopanetetrol glucosamine biosynthesis glycosyltransferase HpnI [Dyella caseinilytica]GGA12463.1 ceramide glucosyltransferase [Dyella caseinilytica]
MSLSWIITAIIHGLGIALAFAAAGYACVALWAVLKAARAPRADGGRKPQPATVLKPLHGAEPRLYENLRSFCLQVHPDYQLVFGVREANDPAIAVVQRLRAEFPQRSIALVVDSRVYGANFKVSNLINMMPQAQHDWLVLADADISVPPDYLTRVTAPLADPGVGIVTCLYHGIPGPSFWSRLGRLFIDDWFAPSVRLSHAFGSTRFAFGSTIALRRNALQTIGGFEALRDTLADDFWLGELTRRAGLRTVLSDVVVGTDVGESKLKDLWTHELRWLRTIRSIAPAGFAMTFVCFTSPLLLLGLCLAPGAITAGLAVLGGGARVLLHFLQRRTSDQAFAWHEVLLIPLRDTLLLMEWAAALAGWQVRWRGQVMHARSGGSAP